MKKLFMMAGVMAAIVLSSCKKDKDSDSDNGGGGSTKLLKKVTETANGTTTVYNVNYDGNKRLSFFSSIDNLETTNFTYDGAGNVIKIEVKSTIITAPILLPIIMEYLFQALSKPL